MPVWLRRTTWNLMQEHFREQNERMENDQKEINSGKNNKSLAKPNIAPNYTVKAPKR